MQLALPGKQQIENALRPLTNRLGALRARSGTASQLAAPRPAGPEQIAFVGRRQIEDALRPIIQLTGELRAGLGQEWGDRCETMLMYGMTTLLLANQRLSPSNRFTLDDLPRLFAERALCQYAVHLIDTIDTPTWWYSARASAWWDDFHAREQDYQTFIAGLVRYCMPCVDEAVRQMAQNASVAPVVRLMAANQ